MSQHRAEFMVVAGPQKGRRLKILGDEVVLGRAAECTIVLKEDYVSRRQLELVKTVQGWLMENLSSNGTLVNGKRYKSGAKIILGTGDVLGMGMETQLLFVEAGDDVDAAVEAYNQKAAPPAPAPVEPATDAPLIELPPSAVIDDADTAGQAVKPPTARLVPASGDAAAETQDTEAAAIQNAKAIRNAKLRKYGPLLGAYFVVMLGIIIYIVVRNGGQKPIIPEAQGLKVLTAKEIEPAILERPKLGIDLTKAADELQKARHFYNILGTRPENKYLCIKHYKLYMAYSGSANMSTADDQKFRECVEGTKESRDALKPNGLVPAVQQAYGSGIARIHAHQWAEAEKIFAGLLELVPEQDMADPTYQGLMKNINAWHDQAKAKMPKKK